MKEFETNPQIEYLQQRVTELQQRAAEGPGQCDDILPEVIEELITTLEELQVSEEELRQQNEELAAANIAVETERRRYLELFDLAPDGYIVTDAKGVIREANRAAAAMLNVSQKFLAGKPFFLYLAEGERKNWHPQLAQLAESDRVENWQTVVQPREGDLFYASMTVARVRDRHGKPTGYRFLVRDITERKKIAEELEKHRHHIEELVEQRTGELRDSNELLERVFSNTHVLIAYMDTDFNFIRVNDAYAAADERDPDFFIGKSHFALYPNKENQAIFRRVVETGELYSVDAKPFEYAEHPERGVSHWDWSLIPIKDAGGDVEGVLLCLVNATDRVRAEEELRNINETLEQRVAEREGQFQLLFSRMNEGFALHEIICDENGEPRDYRFIEVNPAFERLTGLRRSDLTGRTVREVLPGIESHWIETYGKVAITGEPIHFEHYSSQLKKHYEIFAFCPAPREFAALFTDISDRKQFEEALRKSEEDLNRAQAVAHTGSWRMDVRKNELLWSEENHRIFGIPKGAPMTYETFLGTVHPDDREYVDTKWKAALKGEPYDIEHRIVVGDTVKWVRERAGLEFDTDGELLGGFGTTQDITERKQAAEALRESEARLRLAQVSAGAGMWDWDMSSGKLEWSEELFRLFGLDPQKTGASFDTWRSIMHPDDRQPVKKRIEAAIANRTPLANEYRIVLPSGEVRWVIALGNTIYDDDGKPQRRSGICIDITERKQADEALRASEAQARWLGRFPEENPNPVVRVSTDGRVLYRNRASATYAGWRCEVGQPLPESPLRHLVGRIMAEGQAIEEDVKLGETHFAISVTPIQAEGYANIYGRDITKRIQANEKACDALEESERHSAETEALLESSRAVLEHQSFKKAAQAIFESCRNQIGATAGYVALLSRDGTQNELVFLESGGLPCSVGLDLPMPIRGLRAEAYRSGKPVYDNNFADSEWTRYLPPGHVRLDNVMFAPLILGESAVGLMGLANNPGGFTDDDARLASAFADHASIALRNSLYLEAVRNSEAKYRTLSENLDREVKKKVEELQQAQRLAALGQMVSVVAHEIRNPLQNIRMGIDAIRKGTRKDKERVEVFEEVDYGINSLNRIVEDLLEYSRPVKLQCSMWPIRDLVEQALHSLSHRLHTTNVHLELEQEDGEILVDAPKMTRALVNVVSNAAEAMPDGGDLWICSRFSESDGARFLSLSVSDSGCGIDAEGLERIKEPFFTTKTSGTGLGIHICKKIVEAHSGSFSIQSMVNEGTTVEITLPVENS